LEKVSCLCREDYVEKEKTDIVSTPAFGLRPGDTLASAVCATRVLVIRVPAGEQPTIECGGRPMIAGKTAAAASGGQPPAGGSDPATLIGKRYLDAAESVELLCTSSGAGALACDGLPMRVKAAKPLPASD
jgi:hypothetical protein